MSTTPMTAAETAQAERLAAEVLTTCGIQMPARPTEPKTEQEFADQVLTLMGLKTLTKETQ